jgi:hypothetical protein
MTSNPGSNSRLALRDSAAVPPINIPASHLLKRKKTLITRNRSL